MTRLTSAPGQVATATDANILLLSHLSEYLRRDNQPSLRALSLPLFIGDRKGRRPNYFSDAEKKGMAHVETVGMALGIKVETPGGPWKDKIL
jgi:hypothetical protein